MERRYRQPGFHHFGGTVRYVLLAGLRLRLRMGVGLPGGSR